MSIVAGVDFGTLSVRVSIFDRSAGRLGPSTAEYPFHRSANHRNLATQSHAAQMNGFERAMREAHIAGDRHRSTC